jgi:dolichol-phosphate mannosyltransferase
MDADLSHRPRYLPVFFEKIRDCDIVVGSRWMKGGRIANWPAHRVLLSRWAGIYCQLILGVPIADMTAGYVCYRRSVLEKIILDDVHSDGYCFQIEMKYRALQKGFRIIEVPILFTDRKAGDSKISRHIVLEALMKVWWLRFTGSRFK